MTDPINTAKAARAMLAALKAMKLRTQCSSYGMDNDIAEMIRAAIAQAEAAGIKAED